MLENSNYKLYCDRSIIIDWPVHNNRLNIAIFDKAIKEAHLTDVAIPNSHNLHSTITERLQECRKSVESKRDNNMAINNTFIISLVPNTMHITQHKLHRSMKLLTLYPALYILVQKAVIFNTCRIVRKFSATVNKKCETITCLRSSQTAVKYGMWMMIPLLPSNKVTLEADIGLFNASLSALCLAGYKQA
jgi:predicted nucleic acid-binding protein